MRPSRRMAVRPRGQLLFGSALLVALALLGWLWRPGPLVVEGDLAGAVMRAPTGATLLVPAGVHEGPVVVDRPLRLVADAGAVVRGPEGEAALTIRGADGAEVHGLTVRGGRDGIVVERSSGVALRNVVVEGAALHGIFTRDASVTVTGCLVRGLTSPWAQGIELTNSDSRWMSTVQGCRVEGPVYEGIVSHVTGVRFLDNVVTGSTERGIMIHEMSRGRMQGNLVIGAAGAGLWCGDMSICSVIDNRVAGVEAARDDWRAAAGHGLVVEYYSHAYVEGLEVEGLAGVPVLAITGGFLEDGPIDLPLLSPRGVRVIWATALILLALPLLVARAGRVPWPAAMFLLAVAVQLAHQVEHVAQVVQAKVLGWPQAHGFAGAALDNEWVHLGFNSVLLVTMVLILAGYGRPGLARWRGRSPTALGVLLGAVALQGYHQVEHLVKIVQHVTAGATPAPGILGHALDLVWLHFWINLAVTAAMVVGFLALGVLDDLRRPPPDLTEIRAGRVRELVGRA